MTDPKPFASLSPSLLARKGGARPAMRPQYQAFNPHHEATARQLEEDLGWNDMGHDHENPAPAAPPVAGPADVVAIKPAASLLPPKAPAAAPVIRPPAVDPAEVPEVVRQQHAIADRIAETAKPLEKSADLDTVRRSALADGRRAAFTLRLDAERHLKLRLACTISNRSAQQVVTDALDTFIAGLPEVADLAAQVRKRG